MIRQQRGFTAFELFALLLGLLGTGGWIANIFKLVSMNFEPITGLLVVRAVGIVVAPLGAVMGFL